MRSVLLSEDDTILFGSNVNRTLYILYRDNKQNFTNMWKEQGKGYWLQFCITLRAVLQQEGYGRRFFPRRNIPISKNYVEEFYIMFVDYLTGDSITHLHNFVTDVVSVSRFPQLFLCYIDEKTFKNKNGFHRLFVEDSCQQTIYKMFFTLPVLSRAVGCLLKVFQSWLEADQCQTIAWKVPRAWQTTSQLLPFDQHLKKCWGQTLLNLLGVKAVEIGWWNTVSKHEWPSPTPRTSPLGKAITRFHTIDIKDNYFKPELMTKLTMNIEPRKLFIELSQIYSIPREAWLMSFDGAGKLWYTFAATQGLHLVDSAAIFHPYSQYMVHFAYNAFGPRFWSQSLGIEEIGAQFRENLPDNIYSSDDIKRTFNLLTATLTLAEETRQAIQMNSQFFDSLTSSITWTSPVTMVRLVWNMPLCLNWLELLLFKIFEFERYFLPFCHYPLRKAVVSTVTHIYKVLCKEARLLTKLAIMVAEGIYFKESSSVGRCLKARITLMYALECLLPKMKCFLEGTPYNLLDAVLREGWFEYEQDDGESVTIPSDVFSFIDLEGVCVPNVDKQFISNIRSIEYWISFKGVKCLEPKFFSESVKMLESYKKKQSGINCSNYHKLFNSFSHNSYNSEIIIDFAYGGLLPEPDEDITSFRLRLTQHMGSLLQEDGWLRKEHEVTFNQMYMKIISSSRNPLSNDKICDILGKFKHLGAVYNAMALILTDTWEHTIPDQNLLVRLHKAECRAAMTDVSAQFSMFIQKQDHLLQQACPASKFFKEAHLAIKRFSRNIPKMDIKDALAYVVALEKEQCSIKVTTDGALSVELNTTCALANYATEAGLDGVELRKVQNIKYLGSVIEAKDGCRDDLMRRGQHWDLFYRSISNDCKLINPSASNPYQKFLEECEDKRVKLLQLVSNVQFENTKKCVMRATLMTNQLFPLHFLLAFSLVEEMAALQKCQEMGNTSAADRMVELLSLRIVWLQLRFKKWSTESMNPTGPSQGSPFYSLRSGIAEFVSCSWINIIPLKIIFRVYLSKFGTTHPFSESSEFMLWLWANDLLNYTNDVSWLAATDNSMSEYFDELCNTNIDYFAKLLDHCMKGPRGNRYPLNLAMLISAMQEI
uniref:(California timema) hypothetical protein n=1 Tax=Timema californicum TaxID=61474 RepID=A0A7R9J0N3_TIMCA|nr:unnamed protein product [Timema californicum]